MHARNRGRWAALLTGLVVVPLTAAPASAEQLTKYDARGDVWLSDEAGNAAPAPQVRLGDLTRVRIAHTATRVVVRSTYVDLQRTGKRFRQWVEMRDQDGRTTYAGFEATPRDRSGTAWLLRDEGGRIACRVFHRIDYDRNTLLVSWPRRCVHRPRSLQFRVETEQVTDNWAYAYLDNPQNQKAFSTAWTRRLRAG